MEKPELKFIGFRADDELSAAAKKRAKEQHRSLAGYMRHLLERDLSESNTLKEEPEYGKRSGNETAPPVQSSKVFYGPKKTDRQ